mgnify:CR=1 FL=1
MKTFYYNAHDGNYGGPTRTRPVLFQFEVKAENESDADVMAPFIAQHKNGGIWCAIASVGREQKSPLLY